MTPDEAVARLNVVLAHAWMVRQFLKHADDAQEHEGLQDVHRTVFDSIRAVEPAFQRGDTAEYLHRLRGKLPKLRRASEYFSQEWSKVSAHTNFEMAARSLAGCVGHVEEILAAVPRPANGLPPPTAFAALPPAANGLPDATPDEQDK